MATVTLVSIKKADPPRTTVYANFSNGDQIEFESLAAIDQAAREMQNTEKTYLVCVCYAKARSADLSNIQTVANKQFTFDLTAQQPIKVQ